jgi:hypothetical protein
MTLSIPFAVVESPSIHRLSFASSSSSDRRLIHRPSQIGQLPTFLVKNA